jgi:hypothetical protein
MGMKIPEKRHDYFEEETFAYSFSLNVRKSVHFARVKEILGGYSNQEIFNILVDMAIDEYYDGQLPKNSSLPKKLTIQKYLEEMNKEQKELFG